MHPEQSKPTEAPIRRIEALDVARGTALAAMAIYHFAWDLEFFGYAQTGMTAAGGWKLFARCIASSFLFLVGVSLFLAHGRGIRWPGFWRRLAMVAGAAAAISVVTWLAVPGGFIFFGILHQIALASLLGLAFLRLPWWATLIAAAAVIAAPNFLRSEFFAHPAWWWTGLSPANPRSNDYVPVFPWFGAVLIGLASAKLAASQGLFAKLVAVDTGRWSLPLTFAGRHSLAVYLVHQPVLIVGLLLFAQAFPAPVETPEVQFRASCEATCEESRDAEFCTRYCVCMLNALEPDGLLKRLSAGDQSAELRSQIEAFAGQCTVETDNSILEGGAP